MSETEGVDSFDGILELLARKGRLVMKGTRGFGGSDCTILEHRDGGVAFSGHLLNREDARERLGSRREQMITEYVQQAAYAREIYSGSANSIRMLTMTDPEDGSPIIRAVYKRDDIYSGPFINNASELQVGMNEGYRVSWQTTLGGSPPGIVYKNDRKWSADHGGYDYAITSGILVTSQGINTKDPRIIDIAPTVLRYFGLSVPTDIDGKPLY